MSKLFHISDLHLSFTEQGQILKRMDERSWSKGTDSYVNYLQKIIDYGFLYIKPEDFVVISGDLTHDMNHLKYGPSIEWIKWNIPGIKIVIPGNHDVKISFNEMRLKHGDKDIFPLEEDEMINLGPYTFGCYQYSRVGKTQEHLKFIQFAEKLVAHAKSKSKIPVFISHYPVPVEVAEKIGETGVKYYLSGHIHTTQANHPEGRDFKWYDQDAKPTDNKNINGCFFSTATTDLMFHTTGEYFKELPLVPAIIKKSVPSAKELAAEAFECKQHMLNPFDKPDPFNSGNQLKGFICREKGKFQGSLYITHVNNVAYPQIVYGTPKLQYAYKDGTEEYSEKLSYVKDYIIAEKWNGMNVLFYKYLTPEFDAAISAKSKGTPFLTDGDFGNFLTLTKNAMEHPQIKERLLDLKCNPEIQSMSFELCGRQEPHLVKYDFDISLKPLFLTMTDGRIKPISGEEFENKGQIVEHLLSLQNKDLSLNADYRMSNNLPHKYEYEHFAVEGKVLWVLDEEGDFSYDRVAYKIKPKDVEEVHWQTFDSKMQGLVREAVKKIQQEDGFLTEQTLKEELDMGPKEWDKFGRESMKFAISCSNDKRKVTVLCGLPGSGKSTLAQSLKNEDTVVINQDIIGSRKACKNKMETALQQGKNVIIDRCNFDVNQRKCWIDLAQKYGVGTIECIVIDTPDYICKDRVVERKDHPTVPGEEKSRNIVDQFAKIWIEPEETEGFTNIRRFIV